MYYVYVNNDNLSYWLSQSSIADQGAITILTDFDWWLSMPKEKCVALWETQTFDDNCYQQVSTICQHAGQAVLFFPEFISDEWCHDFDQSNVSFFIAGELNWSTQHATVHQHQYFFWSTTDFYHSDTRWLPQVDSTLPKSKTFDVLLGRQKPHRTLIHQQIDHSQNIVTYFESDQDQDLRYQNSKNFQWPTEILPQPTDKICWTGNEVLVDGTIVSLSQLVPVGIYNQTAYTLVAETQCENQFSFFTEKIIKPMMCRRLFLVSSGQYYLRNLRAWGFQTFNSIVDESYDLEPNSARRTEMLLSQVKYLEQQDQIWVYQQAKSIVDHNYNIVMNSRWLHMMCQELSALLTKKLGLQ